MLLAITFVLSAVVSSISAAPSQQAFHASAIAKVTEDEPVHLVSPLPTVEDIMECMHNRFELVAAEYGEKHGLMTHEEFWTDRRYVAEWQGNREFWIRANTSGTEWKKDGVWNTVEWPILLDNPDVTRVIRVNPDNDRQELRIAFEIQHPKLEV
ncbi:hypothetical protein H0H81_011044 [Sphagnurus paluster]|uniref:Uncharacterized protein n=1 Tax=Sphagnurus paluster TaxID=117069 RepID=A0A9P7K3T9_9AGAR|nr:hypothetical protein H0H81_011044 [Sphagnurus paluster]